MKCSTQNIIHAGGSLRLGGLLALVGTTVWAEGDPDVDAPLAALPMPIPAPPDNPITQEKVELGKLLFFDPKLTGDASLSCGDCHDPKQGWGFNDPISRGYPGAVHWRNTHTAVNTAYLNKFFWQGSVGSLEKAGTHGQQGRGGRQRGKRCDGVAAAPDTLLCGEVQGNFRYR